ncbi:ORF2 [Torque teno felis virus-Fc-TTV2]|uniref:ORF2 n=1 Tax=Torque teno felis virus-Fc-TTV2 TaxID=1138484 RepID=A0A678MVE4_9VIRU|nr:ORF2 [Torque teno felis virus-Fc-TTV2]AEZ53063.1 ORF2 [Torque teno felis virus-Fc-TTV2]
MQSPFPRPALMLPAIDLSSAPNLDSDLAYKKREAQWKRLISETHKEWCLCGSYLNHFLDASKPLLNKTCGEERDERLEGADTIPGDAAGTEDISDGDLLEGLELGKQ